MWLMVTSRVHKRRESVLLLIAECKHLPRTMWPAPQNYYSTYTYSCSLGSLQMISSSQRLVQRGGSAGSAGCV